MASSEHNSNNNEAGHHTRSRRDIGAFNIPPEVGFIGARPPRQATANVADGRDPDNPNEYTEVTNRHRHSSPQQQAAATAPAPPPTNNRFLVPGFTLPDSPTPSDNNEQHGPAVNNNNMGNNDVTGQNNDANNSRTNDSGEIKGLPNYSFVYHELNEPLQHFSLDKRQDLLFLWHLLGMDVEKSLCNKGIVVC